MGVAGGTCGVKVNLGRIQTARVVRERVMAHIPKPQNYRDLEYGVSMGPRKTQSAQKMWDKDSPRKS